MPAQTIEELVAAYTTNHKPDESFDAKWKSFYPFYKMGFDDTAVVRFLPDLDESNSTFTVENIKHAFPVNGKRREVPCLAMYGQSCPCCILSAKYYAEEGDDSKNGQMFYKKREWIAQVIVQSSPFQIDNPKDVKLISLSKDMKDLILHGFGDLTNPPYFFNQGHDFRISKTAKNLPGGKQVGDYKFSKFDPKPSDIAPELLEVIAEQMKDLKDWRTSVMDRVVIENMLTAAQTGTEYSENASTPTTTAQPVTTQSVTENPTTNAIVNEAVVAQPIAAASTTNDDILAKIRNRNAAAKTA